MFLTKESWAECQRHAENLRLLLLGATTNRRDIRPLCGLRPRGDGFVQECGVSEVEGEEEEAMRRFYLSLVALITGAILLSCSFPTVWDVPNRCDALNQEGMAPYRKARYSDALEQFQQANVCYQEIGDRAGEGDTLNNIGLIYDRLGQYETALDYYQQGLTISQEIGSRAGEGLSLNNIGGIYNSLGQYEAAVDYYQQSLTISQEIGHRTGEGTTLNNIGLIYDRLGQYEAALDYYRQSLTIQKEIGDRAGEGTTLSNIGLIYDNLGQYEAALDYYQQSLTILKEIGDRAGEGVTLNNIGGSYDRLGQYEAALDYYQQSLTISQKIGSRAGEGMSLNNIGGSYDRLGQYEAALDYYRRSLTIRKEIGDRAGEGLALYSIGHIYDRLGQYEAALDYYQQSLIIRKEIGDRAGEGLSLNNIGIIYNSLGQYEAALDYYQQGLTISQEIGSRAGEGLSLNNIGGIYNSLGQYETALDYYQQSLTISQEIGNRAGEGTTLNNIGLIYDNLGQYEAALDYYQQSLTISQEIGNRAGEGVSLNNIGHIYNRLGQYEAALDYSQQSLIIRKEIGDRAGEGESLSNTGRVYYRLGQYEAALDYYQQAIETLETVRSQAGSEQGRAEFIAKYAFLYHRMVDLLHQQDQAEEAFFTTERGRARAFLDSLTTGQVRLKDDDTAELLAQEQERYTRWQAIRFALAEAKAANPSTGSGQAPPNSDLVADLESQLAEAEAAYQAVQAAIASRGAELASLVPGRGKENVLEVKAVQTHLGPQTTLISYFVLEDKSLAFLITPDNFQVVPLEVSQAELEKEITTFRDFVTLDDPHPESAVTLYGHLIEPLKVHLNTRHLIIVPHSVLHYLPFAALTNGECYLVDDYLLTILPSASALPFIQDKIGRALTNPLILGNPTIGDYDATASFATKRDELGFLHFAEQEAKAIAALYGVEPLIRKAATEKAVRERAATSGILHLAAHGKFNPVAPLSSLIALAPDKPYDGWLTVGEVYGLDLTQTDLVVLSACETQLGDLSAGDELVGLTRAFIFAGTPSLMASLWAVEDETTGLLMEQFYTYLKEGMGKAEALRQAQLEVREEYPNPYYWAAFVLSGDAGKISEVMPEIAGNTTGETIPPIATVAVGLPDKAPAVEPSEAEVETDRGQSNGNCLNLIVIVSLLGVVGVVGVRGRDLFGNVMCPKKRRK